MKEIYFESMMHGGAVIFAPATGSALVCFEFDKPQFFLDEAAARAYLESRGYSEL